MSADPPRGVVGDGSPTGAAWLVCPECKGATDLIRDGVCVYCHYVLCGGDLASDEALRGQWEASLSRG